MQPIHAWFVPSASALALILAIQPLAHAQETYTQENAAERRVVTETAPPAAASDANSTESQTGERVRSRVADASAPRKSVQSSANPKTAADKLQPQRIAEAVENELSHDSLVSLDTVAVSVDGHTATLIGHVDSLIAKERAANLARTVRGVSEVRNELFVQPRVKRNSDEIESMVRQALLMNPATESYEVTITALPDGAVTLAGNVDSWMERSLSERVAKSVSGVTKLTNNIDVSPPTQRTDADMETEIEHMLRWDAYVDAGGIDVAVDDGVVKLSGTVDSAAEKSKAVSTAFTSGTKRVDARALKVASDGTKDRGQQPPELALTDAEVEQALQMRLRNVPELNASDLKVDVRDGVATLRGTVQTLEARRAAHSTAQQTFGVDRVRDRTRVDVKTNVSDTDLESKIVAALAANPVTESYEIGVDVRNGTAHLNGNVDSWFERLTADNVIAGIRGVQKIDNRLNVEFDSARIAYDPYSDSWSIMEYDWYQPAPRISWRRDSTIEEDIEHELFWSPFVDANEVNVSVTGGVATLSGAVDSLAEFNAAQENALEGGAAGVINRLMVEG